MKLAIGSGPDQHADHCARGAKDGDEATTRVFMLSAHGGNPQEDHRHLVAVQERVEYGPSTHSKSGHGTWTPDTMIPIPVTLGTLTSLAGP